MTNWIDPMTDRFDLSHNPIDDYPADHNDTMIVWYLSAFKESHPLNSRVTASVGPNNQLKVHHYCPGAYYCTLITNGKPVLAKIFVLKG